MLYIEKNEKLKKKYNQRKTRKQRKIYLKWTSKPSNISHNIFENTLVTIPKSKLALKHNKPAYNGLLILELSKVLMQEFHYDCNKCNTKSWLLFTDTESLMYQIKTEDFYEDFSGNKEMFDFSKCSNKSKHYDKLKKLVIGKMKDEAGWITTE